MKKLISIIILAGWVGLVLFLSFQNGQDTANTSLTFTQNLLHLFMKNEPDFTTLMLWDGRFRLAAHFFLLFLYGILSVLVLTEWTNRLSIVLTISCVTGLLLAVVTEVGKIAIAGRHYSFSEMCLNAAGALAGIAITSFLWKKLSKSSLQR
jgi:VanZ family protein